MINYYSPQEMTIWSGRVDDETTTNLLGGTNGLNPLT